MDKAEEDGMWAEVAAEQAEQNRILAEERRRILRQHFDQLQGYIPRGLLSKVQNVQASQYSLRYALKATECTKH